MAKVIIGRKLGMTQFFTEDGGRIPVTVIQAGPCPVAQVKSDADHGYDAIQLAYEAVPERKLSKPERGHLARTASSRTATCTSSAARSSSRPARS